MGDLNKIVKEYIQRNGIACRHFHFGNVKVVTREIEWSPREDPNDSETRVLRMDNRSDNAVGTGTFSIRKEGKPVCTCELTQGVLKGYDKAVIFKWSGGILQWFKANISENTTQIIDTTGLKIEANVPLRQRSTKFAEINSRTERYTGGFECKAELRGNVSIILRDESIKEIPIDNFIASSFKIKGNLDFRFEETVGIHVKD